MNISIFHKDFHLLAESPFWSDFHSELFWVDIMRSSLHRMSLKNEHRQYELPEAFTSIIVSKNIVLGITANGFCSFDLECERFERLMDVEADKPGNRSNDGAADNHGGYVFGTMHQEGNLRTGSIYHVDTVAMRLQVLDSDYYIPNGFAFINEYRQLLIADSYLGHIYVYDYDPVSIRLTNKQMFSDISKTGFSPDGMCVTSDNKIWNAEWDGGRLTQYDASGNVEQRISLPVPRPTSCVLDTTESRLYVTSARVDMTASQIEKYPDSGSVMSVELSHGLSD
ncbi:MAG: SMP-30/gluconolactonase/LRE family protein [Candidatus Thiodiazotropha sp.]